MVSTKNWSGKVFATDSEGLEAAVQYVAELDHEGAEGITSQPCGAKTRNGGTCRRWPPPGATRCKLHGGATPRSEAAAARRVKAANAAAAAEEFVKTFGVQQAVEDPALTVVREIQWSRGHVEFLRERVQETAAEALVWSLASETEEDCGEFGPTVSETFTNDPHGWVRLYGEERDRLIRMCTVAARMGIDERLVTIHEFQNKIMIEAMGRTLAHFGLNSRTPEVAAVVGSILRDMDEEHRAVSNKGVDGMKR